MESILFLGLNLYAWIVIVTILTMFTILTFTKLPADVVFMGGMAVLFVSGVLSTQEALAGFSAESVVTIGVLFVVVAGLTYTGVLQWVARYVLGTPLSYAGAVVRLMLPVAGLSAVLNNTSVVALFLNVVKVWGKETGHFAFAPAYSTELCFGHGRGVYAYRYASQPDYFRFLPERHR